MQALPVAYIRQWLAKLVAKGAPGRRGGLTLTSLANHTGIPLNTLKFLAGKEETAAMGFHRQMLLSKVVSQVENGEIEFVPSPADGRKAIAVKATLKPVVRYAAQIRRGRVVLAFVDRPKKFLELPKLKDLWLG